MANKTKKNRRPYQLVDSTIGLMFTQDYVSMKNQRTI